jgi:hypothetical protein
MVSFPLSLIIEFISPQDDLPIMFVFVARFQYTTLASAKCVCVCVCMSACVYVCMCVCMCVCVTNGHYPPSVSKWRFGAIGSNSILVNELVYMYWYSLSRKTWTTGSLVSAYCDQPRLNPFRVCAQAMVTTRRRRKRTIKYHKSKSKLKCPSICVKYHKSKSISQSQNALEGPLLSAVCVCGRQARTIFNQPFTYPKFCRVQCNSVVMVVSDSCVSTAALCKIVWLERSF